MGNVINFPISLDSDICRELIVDCARYSEGLLTEKEVKKKHRFDDATWERLGQDDALVEAIEAEKLRRVRSGLAKRELAQKHVVKAPDVLNTIMLDPAASPKHRIDSAKALDQFAANGPEATPAADRFIITINLSADGSNSGANVLHFDKPLAVGPDDPNPPNEVDTAPQELIPFITSKKKDGDDGQPL
jgi:hypothetical protein